MAPPSEFNISSSVTALSIDERCLACICNRESGCNEAIGCRDGFCGPFQISQRFYRDCGIDGGGFESCANSMACSQQCINNFLRKYSSDCARLDGRVVPTCQDHVRVFHGGPHGCRVDYTVVFWEIIRLCYEAEISI